MFNFRSPHLIFDIKISNVQIRKLSEQTGYFGNRLHHPRTWKDDTASAVNDFTTSSLGFARSYKNVAWSRNKSVLQSIAFFKKFVTPEKGLNFVYGSDLLVISQIFEVQSFHSRMV